MRLPGLADLIDGVLLPDVRPVVTVGEDDELGTAVLELTIPTDVDPSQPDRLRFGEEGIHPIVVELAVDGVVVASHGTVVERHDPDDAPPPIDLSVLTRIADPGPGGSLAEIGTAIERLDATADLADVLDEPFTLSVPPNIARLAVESSTSNDLPAALSDEELIAVPATPFDVSSAVSIGRIDAFANQLTFGEDQLRDALPTTIVRRDAWLLTSPISSEAAAELRDRAVRYMILPQELYRRSISETLPDTDRFVAIDLPDGSTMPILVIDDLGESLTTAATDDILDDASATEWAIRTIATMRFEQYEGPDERRDDERSRILATPDLGVPDPRLLVELERFARSTDAVRFSVASELTGVTSTQDLSDDVRFPQDAGPRLDERLALINATQESLASVASMLPPDDRRLADWTRQLDGFVSTAYSDADVAAAIDEIQSQAGRLRDAVVPPEPISFTLTDTESEIEVRIGNRIEEPLTVRLRLSSERLTFPTGDQIVTLAPDTTTNVIVPVVARSNGTSAVRVEVLTPLGEPITDVVTLRSRVTALTGLGQVVTAGLLLTLLAWWFNNWRTKRRRRDLGGTDPDAATVGA